MVFMSGKNERISKVISTADALEILEKRKKEGDLGYEQQVSYDHVKKFAKLESSKTNKLIKQITGFGVTEKCAVQIADILPIDVLQLKQILSSEKNMPDPETVDKLFKLIEENRGKS